MRRRDQCAPLPAQPERALVHAVIAYLRARGALAWRNQSGLILTGSASGRRRAIHMGLAGLPDVMGCLPGGRLVAVECKRRGNTVTPLQQVMLDELRGRGALVVVAYDVRDVEAALQG